MKAVPKKQALGDLGEVMANTAFQQIGWAPLVKIQQDIGDDYMTFARVHPLVDDPDFPWDLSAPVFVQVKSSATEYLVSKDSHNGREGWWHKEADTDHLDHWLRFDSPYVLVLQDTAGPTTYWAGITAESVVTTGKGRKIFIPADQRVEDSSLDLLNAFATKGRLDSLEGAVWAGGMSNLGPSDRLRNALIMPRLVAPHPNRSTASIDFEPAVALLLQNRSRELAYMARKGLCPPKADWRDHKLWGWRFVAILSELLDTGSSDSIDELVQQARTPFERDACKVVQACAAYVGGEAALALKCLEPSRNSKPTDRGWILAQRAWMHLEHDRPNEAVKCAEDALLALRALDGDRSVSAIRGGCAAVLFAASGASRSNIEQTVTAQDNAASWWRTQAIGHALADDLANRFRNWAAHSPDNGSEETHSALQVAGWNAAFSANWGSWRHIAVQSAQHLLIAAASREDVETALSRLVFCGARSEAKEATQRVWTLGPVSALQRLVGTLAAEQWPRRSEGSVMAVFAQAGDLLTPAEADQAVMRIIDLVAKEGSVRVFAGGWTDRWSEMDSALVRLLSAGGATAHAACAQLIVDNFGLDSGIRVDSQIDLASRLDLSKLAECAIESLCHAPDEWSESDQVHFWGVLAGQTKLAEANLRLLATSGSAMASRALIAANVFELSDWVALGKAARGRVVEMIKDATGSNGIVKYSGYVDDQLHDLTLCAFHTSNNRSWKVVTDALSLGKLPEDQLLDTVDFLIQHFDELPQHVRARLRKTAPSLSGINLPMGPKTELEASVVALQIVAGALNETQALDAMLRLRRNSPEAFSKYLSIWNGPHRISFLLSMAFDDDTEVRARATYQLLRLRRSSSENATDIDRLILFALEEDQGCLVALAAANGLGGSSEEDQSLMLDLLRTHPSSIVRKALSQT